jgi:hypothetical protein
MRLSAMVLMFSVFATGCVTTTTIRSEPQDATVLENGRQIGTTPHQYSSTQWLWETRTLELEAPGYETSSVLLRRTELNPPVAIGSAAVFMLLCWPAGAAMFLAGGLDYPGEVYVRMRAERPTAATPPPSMRY